MNFTIAAFVRSRATIGERHQPAVDGAIAGDQPVTEQFFLLHPESMGAVNRQGVELHEGVLIQKHLDTFAGGVLSAVVLLLYGGFPSGGQGLITTTPELGELASGGGHVSV